MSVSPLLNAIFYPDARGPAAAAVVLKPGDLLSGKIANITDSGKVLIDFGSVRLLADTDLAFHRGDKIRVRVEEIGDQIKLKHLPADQPAPGSTKTPPGAATRMLDRLILQLPAALDRAVAADGQAAAGERLPDSVRQALLSVREFLQPTLATVRTADLAALLQRLVENSGHFFEKRMQAALEQQGRAGQGRAAAPEAELAAIRQVLQRDLKPNALILKNYLEDPAARPLLTLPEREDLKAAVDRLLAGLDRQQHHFRAHPPDAEPPPAVSVFFHLKKTGQKGVLKLFADSRASKKTSAGSRITLLLRMDRIGDIQSDLFLLDKTLQVSFQVADEAVKRFLESQTERIRDALKDHFASVKIEVRQRHQLGQQLEAETAAIYSDSQIDLRV